MTIIVVPHSSQEPWSVRVPRLLIEVVCLAIGICGIGLLLFTNSYQRMTAHMEELWQLRETTREQRAKIDDLNRRAEEVQHNLVELEELERQLREMLDLPMPGGDADSSQDGADLSWLYDGNELGLFPDARPRAQIAQLNRAAPARGAVRSLAAAEADALTNGFDVEARDGELSETFGSPGVGGQIPALLDPNNLGGLANLVSPQYEPTGAEEAAAAREDFLQARAHSAELLDRLTALRQEAADKLAYLAAKPSIWPAYGPVTSEFGVRYNPFGWGTEFHAGIDIGAPYGSPIVATGDGTVIFAGWDAGYGRKVEISHGYGLVTVYAHASELAVSVGDQVETGDVIGYVGSSGRSTAPHLHYEVWLNGRLTDPWEFLP